MVTMAGTDMLVNTNFGCQHFKLGFEFHRSGATSTRSAFGFDRHGKGSSRACKGRSGRINLDRTRFEFS
jgi:hypothetical protein